jgi:hypothetical protein
LSFTPLSIEPFSKTLSIERPLADEDDSHDAHATITAWEKITVLNFKTSHIENMKVCHSSFVDAIMNGDSLKPVCEYTDEYESTYDDAYWFYNAGSKIEGLEDYVGKHAYFIKMLF